MNKVYILAPLIALVAFIPYYKSFSKEYEEAAQAKIEDAKEQRKQELIQEAADREKAIKAALALNAERKAERAAKDAQELAEKEARQAAVEANDTARSERNKLENQVERFEGTIADVKQDLEEIAVEKERLNKELEFLGTYVTAAEKNVASLQQVIRKINEANAARAAAAAAAAAAKK